MESTAIHSPGERASIYTLATFVVVFVAGGAFAAGWLIGRILS